MDRAARGRRTEALALRHLEAHGLTMLARNYRCRMGEIDLVMRDGTEIVFVEVRYRRDAGFGGAAASVDGHKQRRLALAAGHFLATRVSGETPVCRFDVVAMGGALEAPRIEWITAAFDAG